LQATKTAINAVTPIEPFKLFHKINESVSKAKPEIEKLRLERTEVVSVPGRSSQPFGMAQIGFAVFWPDGGGIMPSPSNSNETAMQGGPSSSFEGAEQQDSLSLPSLTE
jgi:hypothetical protein